jgi:alpha-1,3-mannosyl-glycoprotein beta-1,2-N-acetylglucosaminyltransferase
MKFNKRFAFSIAIVGFWTCLTCIILVNLRYNSQAENAKNKKITELLSELDTQIQKKVENRKEIVQSYHEYFDKFRLPTETPAAIVSDLIETETENHVNNILIDFEGKYVDDDYNKPVIPIIVFACNRVAVSRSLKLLVQYRPSKKQFPIIVSQVSSIKN